MTSTRANLFTRDDTFFGVCEGLGQDLGIPSNLLRIAFVPLLFVQPVAAAAAYLALGLAMAAVRRLLPDRAAPAATVTPLPLAPAAAPVAATEPLPLAA